MLIRRQVFAMCAASVRLSKNRIDWRIDIALTQDEMNSAHPLNLLDTVATHCVVHRPYLCNIL